MIDVDVIQTGSKGNCYIINMNGFKFMIDCGSKLMGQYQLEHNFNNINCCFISHAHQDHCQYVNKLNPYNIKLVASKETFRTMEHEGMHITSNRLVLGNLILHRQTINMMNDFEYMAFEVPHDSPNYGFMFKYKHKKVVYITDCGHIPQKWYDLPNYQKIFENVDVLMIEANYSEAYSKPGLIDEKLRTRVLGPNGHLSLEESMKFVKHLRKTNPRMQTLLLHYSEKQTTPEIRSNLIKGEPKGIYWANKNQQFKF